MDILVWIGIALAICVALATLGNLRGHAQGTGYYSRYGPHSSRETRLRVDEAQQLARRGARRYWLGDKTGARSDWQDALDLEDDPDARACLGIALLDDGDLHAALGNWAVGRSQGHWASVVFQTLGLRFEEPDPTLRRATTAFLRALGDLSDWERQNAKQELSTIAAKVGLPEAAEAIRGRVDAVDYEKLHQYRTQVRGR